MRIAIIEPVGGHGGMDHYAYGLAQGLVASGAAVDFHTCAETRIRNIEGVSTRATFGRLWEGTSKRLRLWRYIRGFWNSLREAERSGCTVVHLHFFGFGWLTVLTTVLVNRFRFKKVLTVHDVSDFRGREGQGRRSYVLSSYDHLIVHNEFSRRQLQSIYNGRNVSVIPHGHYLHSVSQLPYKPDVTQPLQLLFFGQVKRVKGLDILIRAMGSVVSERSDVHLTIAGKIWHDDPAKYERLIAEMGVAEHVTTRFGFIPDHEVSDYFKRADVVVLPYRRIYQSGVLLLSMSYGRAVITSDLEPFAEVIDDRVTGLMFRADDPSDLAKTIVIAAEHRRLLIEVAQSASQRLRSDFEWASIGRATRERYDLL